MKTGQVNNTWPCPVPGGRLSDTDRQGSDDVGRNLGGLSEPAAVSMKVWWPWRQFVSVVPYKEETCISGRLSLLNLRFYTPHWLITQYIAIYTWARKFPSSLSDSNITSLSLLSLSANNFRFTNRHGFLILMLEYLWLWNLGLSLTIHFTDMTTETARTHTESTGWRIFQHIQI